MRPEPLWWERKERNKKQQERSDERSSLSKWTPSRWAPTHFRRPPGYGKQGGWHLYFEESGHGFMSSRYNEKNLDDDRPSCFFVDGKYSRNSSRESRGNFAHKDWKGQSWDSAASPSGLGRQSNVSDQRLVDDMLPEKTHPPHSESSDFVNSCDQNHFNAQQDKNGDINCLGTGQRFEIENSLGSDWKPVKWFRSGSLSSRGSGFSHSSSSKSMGVDSIETKADVQPRNVTPVQSPSGDAAACVTSAALPEETSCRKKPRLRWGEGLAKYEKKKDEGADDNATKNGMVTAGASNTLLMHSLVSNLADKSPRVACFSDCASPATPSSVACSSSSGLEDNKLVKGVDVYNDSSVLSGSPGLLSQDHFEGLAFSLENLDLTSVATLNSNLSSSISELMQSDDPSSVDCSYVRSTATNKLLVWKGEILKAIEMTESEIDLLENELKAFVYEPRSGCPCPTASSSLAIECHANPCEELGAATNVMPGPTPLQIETAGDVITGRPLNAPEEEHAEVKDEDIDSPGTVTSKFVEPLCLGKAVSLSDRASHGECSRNLDMNRSGNLAVKCSVYGLNNEEKTGFVSAYGDGAQLIAPNSCASLSTDGNLHRHREEILYDRIFASNKDTANTASEALYKLLPTDQCYVDISRAANISCLQNDDLIKGKFATRKRFLRFKERVLTLKFRAFQHLWKEDMRLLSLRKYHAKRQKKFDLSLRLVHSGYPRNRSPIRSRFSSPAGSLSLVPTTEIINFTSRLLSDSQVKLYSNTVKMPALILDKKEKMISQFISSNGLVENPCAVEKERSFSNPWTSDEKEIFIDKLAAFGKDFKKIASFFNHKTTADCIEFYYKNHKSDCFEKAKKKPEFAKHGKSYSTNTYLVTSGKRWNRESNAASLDLLGAASAMAANVDDGRAIQQKCTSRYFFGASSDYKVSRGEGILERSSSLNIFGNERETVAADVLAGICSSFSSEAVSSCITSSVDPGECYQEWKCQKVTRRSPTPEVIQNFDDETCSDESCGERDSADWTDEEKSIFIQAVASYGKDFAMISRCIRTRSRDQCKVFFSKARKCLGLDIICPVPGNQGTPMSDEANGGGSDGEDACVVETDSVICSDKSGSKMEEDLPISDLKIKHGASDPAGTMNLQPDLNRSGENDRPGKLECKDARLMSENSVYDGHQMDHKLELDLDGDCNNDIGVICESVKLQGQGSAIMPSNSESERDEAMRQVTSEKSTSVGVPNDKGLPTRLGAAEIETKAVREVSAEASKAGLLLLPKDSLHEKRAENTSVIGSDCAIQDWNSVPQSVRDGSDLAVDTHSSSEFVVISGGYQHKADLEFDSAQKTLVSLQQDNLTTMNSVPQDFSAVKNEKTLNNDSSSTLGLKKINELQCQKSASMDDYHQHLSRPSLLDHPIESSQILKGYPLSVSPKMQMDGGIGCKKSAPLEGISKLDRNFHSKRFLEQDCYLLPCNSLKHHGSVGELPFLSQELTRDLPRAPSRTSSDVEKPCRNGDVKLFGQILTHPSPQQKPNGQILTNRSSHQKPNSNTHDNEDKSAEEVIKSSGDSFNLKLNGTGGNSNYLAHYYQTGVPSLPESAILLAKYPAALSNYPTPSLKIEHNAVKSIESTLNATSVFPTREISSSNGVADYQVYRSRDGTRVQPFPLDVKQRQDLLFTEMQRRNGFETVSSIQQQAKGMVGINVSGRGGILVGGSITGVADPVAAIKIHYAKAEQYSLQAGSITRDEDSWRGKGDIGR